MGSHILTLESAFVESLAGQDLRDAASSSGASGRALLGPGHVQDVAALAAGGEGLERRLDLAVGVEELSKLDGHRLGVR